MGFVGASPFHSSFLNWAGGALGVAVVYVGTRWLGHATACDVAAEPRDDRGEGDARDADQSL